MTAGSSHKGQIVYMFLTFYYSMYTREGNGFPPSLLPRCPLSLSHSPLTVIPIFELHGPIRHSGAILPESRIKKTQLLTTDI